MQGREGGPAVHGQQREGARGEVRHQERIALQVALELVDEDQPRGRGREEHVEEVAEVEADEHAHGGGAELREPPPGEQDQRSGGRDPEEVQVQEAHRLRAQRRDELLRPHAGDDAEQPAVQRGQRGVDVVRVHEADGVVQVRIDEDAGQEGQHLAQGLDVGRLRPYPARGEQRDQDHGRAGQTHDSTRMAVSEIAHALGVHVRDHGQVRGGKQEDERDDFFDPQSEDSSHEADGRPQSSAARAARRRARGGLGGVAAKEPVGGRSANAHRGDA